MSKAEILAELPNLSAGERDDVRRRLAELDEENADAVALARAEDAVIGTLQFSRLPGLARDGMFRAVIESVHVSADWQGRGVGAALVEHAMAHARALGCGMIQLTSDHRRTRAHAFYQRLGFVASHLGMKRLL